MTARATRRTASATGPGRWPHPTRTAAVAVVAIAVSLSLTAAQSRAGAQVKDDRFLTAQTPGVLHIEAGECFSDPFWYARAGEVVVVYTPCDQSPVDNQVYGFVDAPDGPWDADRLAEFGDRRCAEGFAHYWPDDTRPDLDHYPVLPTAQTWADGDRTVMCVVYDRSGPMAGSALPRAR